MPEVSIIEPTSFLANSSIAIPGLKHHQLSFLDDLPELRKHLRFTTTKAVYNLHDSLSIEQAQYLFLSGSYNQLDK